MNKLVNIVRKQLSDTIVGEDDGGANNIRNGAVSIFASLGEVNGMKLGKSDDNKAMRNKEGKRNERFAKSKSGVGEKEVDVNEDDMAMNAPHMTFKFSNADKRLLRRHAITIDTSKPGVTVSSTIKTENLKKANMKTTTDKKKSVNMKRRAIIATVASYDIREMVRNLACFVSQTSQESKPIVFALDSALSKYLRKYKIPSIGFHASVQVKSANETKTAMRTSTQGRQRPSRDGVPAFWGTQKFSGISNNKLVVAYHLLRTGYDVLLTDVDVMWCRDMISTFTTFLHEYPKYDMFMQSNRPRENSTGQLNTGFYYAKSTSGVISLFESLSKHSPGAILRGQDDQTFFWGFMCRAGHPPTDGSKTGVLKYENGETSCQWNDGKVLLFFLPLMEFPNGAVRFNKEDGSRWSVHPAGFYRDKCKKQEVVMWHVNYVSASMKRHMMMTQDVWISRENGTCATI